MTRLILLFSGLILLTGCSGMTPGKYEQVALVSDRPRAGNVYLLRGFIGIFSTGIDSLGQKLNDQGIQAQVFQDDQWWRLADTIVAKYKDVKNPEPLVLIGHSYGADDVVRIARKLDEHKIKVSLLVTLDPVTPPMVPANVVHTYNLYQSNGAWDTLPWLRGIPLTAVTGAGKLDNINIRTQRTDLLEPGTDHFNIEKKETIHREVIGQVIRVCPERPHWTATKAGTQISAQTAGDRLPQGPSSSTIPGKPAFAGSAAMDGADMSAARR